MAGGPYNIPRNTKGEGRFFYIFSTLALLTTIVFAIVGYVIFYVIGVAIKVVFTKTSPGTMGFFSALVFGLIGFIITTFKVPDSNNFEITRKAGRGIYI